MKRSMYYIALVLSMMGLHSSHELKFALAAATDSIQSARTMMHVRHRRQQQQQIQLSKRKQQQREPRAADEGLTSITTNKNPPTGVNQNPGTSNERIRTHTHSQTHNSRGYSYNQRSAQRYIEKIRTLNQEQNNHEIIQKDNTHNKDERHRRLPAEDDKDKDKDKDKEKEKDENNNNNKQDNNKGTKPPTRAPTPSPTPAPTRSPTKYPTRSPAILPWHSEVDGYVEVGVSIFTHEEVNNEILQGLTGADVSKNGNGNYDSVDDILPRLNAGDILAGKQPELIKDVLSTMATVFCGSMGDEYMLLNVVNDQFYNYCDGATGTPVLLELLPNGQNVLVTDVVDDGTMLLNVEDRSVYVNNWRQDGNGNPIGDYLHWTMWTIQYAIVQIHSDIVDLEVVDDDEMRGLLLDDLLGQIQKNVDQAFATAVSNGEMDNLLSNQSDNVLKVSSIGWEVETFTTALDEVLVFDDDESDNNSSDVDINGAVTGEVEKPARKIQLIQIVGVVLLVGVTLFVAIVMKVGHERYKYDVWDATHGDKGDKSDVNLVTYEGVDFMLDSGRHARTADDVLKSRSSSAHEPREHSTAMDMGNSPSELVGQSQPPKASSPLETSSESYLSGFMRRFGHHDGEDGQIHDDDYENFTVTQPIVAPKLSTRWDSSPNNVLPPPPPPDIDSPTTSALLRKAEEDQRPMTPPQSSRQRFRFGRGGGSRGEPRVPGTPDGAERIQADEGGEFAFVAVSTKAHPYDDPVRRSSTL